MWHYTTGTNALEIIRSGVLKPATAHILPGETPILWFSANKVWEPTASKAVFDGETVIHLSRDQTRALCGGLFRFSAPAGIVLPRWPDIGQQANMRPAIIRALTKTGRAQGANPSHWGGLFKGVPISGLQFQCFSKENEWVDVPAEEEWVKGLVEYLNNK